jgi:hypothetical protein
MYRFKVEMHVLTAWDVRYAIADAAWDVARRIQKRLMIFISFTTNMVA